MEFPNEKQAFFSGGADLKVMVAIGLVMANRIEMILFLSLMMGVGVLYKSIAKYYSPKEKNIAFIPVFLISYLLFLVISLEMNI